MTHLLLLAILLVSSHDVRPGALFHYSQRHGDMTAIAQRQGVTLQPGEWCIAAFDEDDLGRPGTLAVHGRLLRIRVCDFAHPDDRAAIRARGIVAELPYPLAVELGMIADGRTTGTLALEGR